MKVQHVLWLSAILLVYLCIGAAIFQATEQEAQHKHCEHVMNLFDNFTARHSNSVARRELAEFLQMIITTGITFDGNDFAPPWDFAGSFTFAVTVVTTVGYGHSYPRTNIGRAICVVYALIGIPLTIIVLGGIGHQMTNITHRLAKKTVCSRHSYAIVVMICFSAWILVFLVPSVMFRSTEGWTILEGLYYCFITLSTIGFGDYVAGRSTDIKNETVRGIYRIAVYVWILIGLAYISLVISFICKIFGKAGAVKRKANEKLGSCRLQISLRKLPTDAPVVAGPRVPSDTKYVTPESFHGQKTLSESFSSAERRKYVYLTRITRRCSN